MPTFRKPGEYEKTIALTSDDIEPPSLEEDPVTARPRGRGLYEDDPSMRDRTVPLYQGETPTLEVPGAHSQDAPTVEVTAFGHEDTEFAPPPFRGVSYVNPGNVVQPRAKSNPPAPLLTSHIESPPVSTGRSGVFAPISTFPPSTVRSPTEDETVHGHPLPAAPTQTPGWVIGYLVLCAALTLIGLVVLYFEHRMLGNSSPL